MPHSENNLGLNVDTGKVAMVLKNTGDAGIYFAMPQDNQPKDIIKGAVKPGLTLCLVNSTKVGAEIWLVIGKAVQEGTPFAGAFPTVQAEVLNITSARADRWQKAFHALPHREVVTNEVKQGTLDYQNGVPVEVQLDGYLNAVPGLRLLETDDITKFLPTAYQHERMGHLKHLNDKCADRDLAFLGVLDLDDPEQMSFMASIAGEIDETDIGVIAVKANTDLNLGVKFIRAGNTSRAKLIFENGAWRKKERAKADRQLKGIQAEVYKAFNGFNAPVTAHELALATSLDITKVTPALSILVKKNLLVRQTRGFYTQVTAVTATDTSVANQS